MCSSGKCQITHWRQGHKDECRPLTNFAVKQSGIHNNDSEVERVFKTSSDTSSVIEEDDDDGNLKRHADCKARHIAPSSLLAGVSPSSASFGSLIDVSLSRTVLPGPNDKLGRQLSDDIPTSIPGTMAAAKKMGEANSPSSESNLTYSLNNYQIKLNKKKSIQNDEEAEYKMRFAKDNNLTSDDAHPAKPVYKKSTEAVSSEMLVTAASKNSNLTSVSSSRPKSINNGGEDGVQHNGSKYVKSYSVSASNDHSSSVAGGHSVPSSNSGLPAKNNATPTLPQAASNGLKTSMRKVVQQFKASKQSKSYIFGFGNEVNGKHNKVVSLLLSAFVDISIVFLCHMAC